MSEEINLVTAFQGDRKSPKDPYRASAVLERALITGAAGQVTESLFKAGAPVVKAITDPVRDVIAGPLSTTFKSKQANFLAGQGPRRTEKNFNKVIDYKKSIEKRLEEARNAGISHRQQIENELIVPMGNEIRKEFDRYMLENNPMYDSTKYDEKLFQNIARVRMNQPMIEASDEDVASFIKSPAIRDSQGELLTRDKQQVFKKPVDKDSIINQIYNAEKNFLNLAKNVDDKTAPLALQSLAAIAMPSNIVQSLRKGDVRQLNTIAKTDTATFQNVAEMFMAATYADAQKELETGIDVDELRPKINPKTGEVEMVRDRSYEFKSPKLNALYNTFVELNKAGMAVNQLTSIDQFEMFKDAYTEEQILQDAEALGQSVSISSESNIEVNASGEFLIEKTKVKKQGIFGDDEETISKEVVMDLSEGENQFVYAKGLQLKSLTNLLKIQTSSLSEDGIIIFNKMLTEKIKDNRSKYLGRDGAPISVASTTMSLPQYNELLSMIFNVGSMRNGLYAKGKSTRMSAVFEYINSEFVTTSNRLRDLRSAVRAKPLELRTENFEYTLDNALLLNKDGRFNLEKFSSPTNKELLREIPEAIYQHPHNPDNYFKEDQINEHIKQLAFEEFTRRENLEEIKNLNDEVREIFNRLNTITTEDSEKTTEGTTLDDNTGFVYPIIDQKDTTLRNAVNVGDEVISVDKTTSRSSLIGRKPNINTRGILESMLQRRKSITGQGTP